MPLFGPETRNPRPSLQTRNPEPVTLTAPPLRLVYTPLSLLVLLLLAGCPPDQPPLAEFTGTPLLGSAPLEVQFQDYSLPGGQAIREWQWDFGDGESSTERNPVHTYAAAGTYPVYLRVRTSVGESDDLKTRYVNVSVPGVQSFRVFCRNTGNYPVTSLYVIPADAQHLGNSLFKTPLDPGATRLVNMDFPPNLYIVTAGFAVGQSDESAILPENMYALALLDARITLSLYWNTANTNGIAWQWGLP